MPANKAGLSSPSLGGQAGPLPLLLEGREQRPCLSMGGVSGSHCRGEILSAPSLNLMQYSLLPASPPADSPFKFQHHFVLRALAAYSGLLLGYSACPLLLVCLCLPPLLPGSSVRMGILPFWCWLSESISHSVMSDSLQPHGL